MAYKYEVNGHVVEFDKEPTEYDIDEAASQLGDVPSDNSSKKSPLNDLINNYGADVAQIGGNILGAVAGVGATVPTGGVINPLTGAILGGTLARGGYEGYNQTIDKFINKKPYEPSKILNELSYGMGSELLGFGTAKAIGAVGKTYTGIKDTLKSGKSAKTLLDDLIKQKDSLIKTVESKVASNEFTKKYLMSGIKKESSEKIAQLESQKPLLDLNVDEIAKKKTLEVRDAYHEFTGKLNNDYGEAWGGAMRGEKVPLSKQVQALDAVDNSMNLSNYYDDSGNYVPRPESTLSESEKKFLRYKRSVVDMTPTRETGLLDAKGNPLLKDPQEINRPLEDVISEFEGLFGKKSGTKFSSGEHVITKYKESLADLYDNEKIRLVKSKFKPKLQLKNELYKRVQPYNRSGIYDTKRGQTFFKSLVEGNDPDVNDIASSLKREFPGLDLSDLQKAHQDRLSLDASIKGTREGAVESVLKTEESFDKASYLEQYRAARSQQQLDELISMNEGKVAKADKTKKSLSGIVKKTAIGAGALWGADKAKGLLN